MALPTLTMMSAGIDVVQRRAQQLIDLVSSGVRDAFRMEIVESSAQAGSGAMPLAELASRAVAIAPRTIGVEASARRLRRQGVVGRIAQDRLFLDMRTVADEEVAWVARALAEVAL